jgi:P27 family predicted phage terminase small subunit
MECSLVKKRAESGGNVLSPEAARWKARLLRNYALQDEAGVLILETALQAFDRMRQAQDQIARDGVTYRDRFDQPRAHPLLTTERDSRAAFLAGLKQLNLDLEPLRDGPGRPPAG